MVVSLPYILPLKSGKWLQTPRKDVDFQQWSTRLLDQTSGWELGKRNNRKLVSRLLENLRDSEPWWGERSRTERLRSQPGLQRGHLGFEAIADSKGKWLRSWAMLLTVLQDWVSSPKLMQTPNHRCKKHDKLHEEYLQRKLYLDILLENCGKSKTEQF